jgi:hypothetical protein
MGIVRMGIPEELALLLRDKYRIPNFVETGTYQGGTAEWATRHFEKVLTIEGQKKIYEATSARLSSIPNLTCLLGDSRDVFKETCAGLDGPTLFWLDSHWCGQETIRLREPMPAALRNRNGGIREIVDGIGALPQCPDDRGYRSKPRIHRLVGYFSASTTSS